MHDRYRGEAPQGIVNVRAGRHLGHRAAKFCKASGPRHHHSPAVCRQARRLGPQAVPQAGIPDLAGAERTSLHRHFRNNPPPDHIHQPQFRENDIRRRAAQGLGRNLRSQLLQHSEGSGIGRRQRIRIRLQQQIPGRPAAIQQHRHNAAGLPFVRHPGNHRSRHQAGRPHLPSRNTVQEIGSHPLRHHSRAHPPHPIRPHSQTG